jgi:hypothetical protein
MSKQYAFTIRYRPFYHDHFSKFIKTLDEDGEDLAMTLRLTFNTKEELHIHTFKMNVSSAFGMDGHVMISIEGGLIE